MEHPTRTVQGRLTSISLPEAPAQVSYISRVPTFLPSLLAVGIKLLSLPLQDALTPVVYVVFFQRLLAVVCDLLDPQM